MVAKNTRLQQHVIFCPHLGTVKSTGTTAEHYVIQYLVDNLNPRKVGDYQILAGYRLPVNNAGGSGTVEIDILLVNKFGVFLFEVKDRKGTIIAYDKEWIQSQKYSMGDVFGLLEAKSNIIYTTLFGKNGNFKNLSNTNVAHLIVLYQGKRNFRNESRYDDSNVVELDDQLLQYVSTPAMWRRKGTDTLSDEDIQRIAHHLFSIRPQTGDELIGNYRIISEIWAGDLFDAYKAQHLTLEDRQVRIKVYQSPSLSQSSERLRHQFERDAKTITKLGVHPNILQLYDFFIDSNRPDTFYEVTELVDGFRLDELLSHRQIPVPLSDQLGIILPICEALSRAHENGICHRNLNPETIFITQKGIVKVGDFDFAKIEGTQTIAIPGQVLVDTPYTDDEIKKYASSATPVTDIYSVGAIWYYMATLPGPKLSSISLEKIDHFDLPVEAKLLMRKMLSPKASRPKTARDIIDEINNIIR